MKIIEQFFAADEQHESDRGEQEQRKIFAAMRGVLSPRARITVKKASIRQMILKSDVSGEMTSIP